MIITHQTLCNMNLNTMQYFEFFKLPSLQCWYCYDIFHFVHKIINRKARGIFLHLLVIYLYQYVWHLSQVFSVPSPQGNLMWIFFTSKRSSSTALRLFSTFFTSTLITFHSTESWNLKNPQYLPKKAVYTYWE